MFSSLLRIIIAMPMAVIIRVQIRARSGASLLARTSRDSQIPMIVIATPVTVISLVMLLVV